MTGSPSRGAGGGEPAGEDEDPKGKEAPKSAVGEKPVGEKREENNSAGENADGNSNGNADASAGSSDNATGGDSKPEEKPGYFSRLKKGLGSMVQNYLDSDK